MAYTIEDARIGLPTIESTNTTQDSGVLLGTVVRAKDPTYGQGEFIYLLGATNTIVGSVVIYNATTYQTVLPTVSANANSGAPVAVAMSVNVGSQYGWYQIAGNAVVKKTAVAVTPQVPVMLSATAGRVKVLTSAGIMIVGARSANLATVASTVSTVVVTLSRAHVQGQIT